MCGETVAEALVSVIENISAPLTRNEPLLFCGIAIVFLHVGFLTLQVKIVAPADAVTTLRSGSAWMQSSLSGVVWLVVFKRHSTRPSPFLLPSIILLLHESSACSHHTV